MHPILFHIGPVTIYSYGVALAVGFLLSVYFASQKAEETLGIDPAIIYSFAITVIILGLVGARIFYVFNDWGYFRQHPAEIVMFHRGGLVYYGALIFGSIGGVLYLKNQKLSVLDVADVISPYIALGHGIGRVGCFLNGCCYGSSALFDRFLLVFGHGTRMPIQVVSTVANLGIFLFLLSMYSRRRFQGQILALYFLIYAAVRFGLEMFRGDPVLMWGSLRISQGISIALFIFGAVMYVNLSKKNKSPKIKP